MGSCDKGKKESDAAAAFEKKEAHKKKRDPKEELFLEKGGEKEVKDRKTFSFCEFSRRMEGGCEFLRRRELFSFLLPLYTTSSTPFL